jgi:hypothetical protein
MDTDLLISTISDGQDIGNVERLPSFFEIILVDKINDMLKPAIRHIFTVMEESLPASLIPISSSLRSYSDESCKILVMLIQWVCIKRHGTSVAELLYGLNRRNVLGGVESSSINGNIKPKITKSTPATKWQQEASIFFVAIMPILLDTIKTFSRDFKVFMSRQRVRRNREREEQEDRNRESLNTMMTMTPMLSTEGETIRTHNYYYNFINSVMSKVSNAFELSAETIVSLAAESFPYLYSLAGLSVVMQKFNYLCGGTVYSHPLLALINIALVRKDPKKHDIVNDNKSNNTTTHNDRNQQNLHMTTKEVQPPSWHTTAVIGAVVCVRGLQWFLRNRDAHANLNQRMRLAAVSVSENNGNENNDLTKGLPPPPCPNKIRNRNGNSSVNADKKGVCPLCESPHRSPAVSTGGYVFCHSCLLLSLKRDVELFAIPSCPVTGIPCKEEDIIVIH